MIFLLVIVRNLLIFYGLVALLLSKPKVAEPDLTEEMNELKKLRQELKNL